MNWLGIIHTPRDHIDIIERVGQYHRMLKPGWHIFVPFVDQLRERVNMTEQVVVFPPQSFTLQAGTTVTLNVTIFYQITRPKDAIYQVDHLLSSLQRLVATTLNESLSPLDINGAIANRKEIIARLRQALDAAGAHWGIRIASVQLDVANPREFQAFAC